MAKMCHFTHYQKNCQSEKKKNGKDMPLKKEKEKKKV